MGMSSLPENTLLNSRLMTRSLRKSCSSRSRVPIFLWSWYRYMVNTFSYISTSKNPLWLYVLRDAFTTQTEEVEQSHSIHVDVVPLLVECSTREIQFDTLLLLEYRVLNIIVPCQIHRLRDVSQWINQHLNVIIIIPWTGIYPVTLLSYCES